VRCWRRRFPSMMSDFLQLRYMHAICMDKCLAAGLHACKNGCSCSLIRILMEVRRKHTIRSSRRNMDYVNKHIILGISIVVGMVVTCPQQHGSYVTYNIAAMSLAACCHTTLTWPMVAHAQKRQNSIVYGMQPLLHPHLRWQIHMLRTQVHTQRDKQLSEPLFLHAKTQQTNTVRTGPHQACWPCKESPQWSYSTP
jgi:hypothetical protein